MGRLRRRRLRQRREQDPRTRQRAALRRLLAVGDRALPKPATLLPCQDPVADLLARGAARLPEAVSARRRVLLARIPRCE
jgi:hypothetical protein